MNIEFDGKLVDGRLTLNHRSIFTTYLASLKDGNYYLTIARRKGPPKTLEQLGYFHAVVVRTVYNQMVEDGQDSIVIGIGKGYKEIPLTEDMVVVMLKMIWAKEKGVDIKSKAKMTKEEASELIDVSIRWAARWLSCVIPPPEGE